MSIGAIETKPASTGRMKRRRRRKAMMRVSKGSPLSLGKIAVERGAKRRKKKFVQIKTVRSAFGVSQDELSRITGYSIRAIAGWEAGKKLSAAARQKLAETDRLRAALAEIVPSAELGKWMRTPNPAFEGQTPIQVVERGETDRIWRMIIQIDSGVAN